MISLHLPTCLDKNPEAAARIGRLVLQYGELEWMLCRVVAEIVGDLDVAVKAMYRIRGEHARLEIADALVSNKLDELDIADVAEATFKGVNICREIRNSYAHAHWLSHLEEEIGFYDLESQAKSRKPLDLRVMRQSVLSLATLGDQERYFAEVLHNLVHLFYELEARSMGSHAVTQFLPLDRPPGRAQPMQPLKAVSGQQKGFQSNNEGIL